MRDRRLLTMLSVFALATAAACGGEDTQEVGQDPAAEVMETAETVPAPEPQPVEAPVPTQDTAVVETQVDVDTEVDTSDVAG